MSLRSITISFYPDPLLEVNWIQTQDDLVLLFMNRGKHEVSLQYSLGALLHAVKLV